MFEERTVRLTKAGLYARFKAVIVAGMLAAACSSPVDLKQAVQVTDIGTGWFDAGVVDGKNKLVPSVSFRLRNDSGKRLDAVALNIVFKFADTGDDHEEIFKQRVPFENNQTRVITVRSQNGYTGEPPQTRADMLKNSQFRDMDAVVFVRQSGAQWIELQRVRIERQLLTH